jgi:adenine-specific DNA-methyltransferase
MDIPDNRLHDIEKILGAPFYKGPGVSIYCGDCTDILPRLPIATINLTITSPPYNIGKEYEKILDVDEYIAWCEAWICEIYNITQENGSFWLNLGYLSLPDLAKAIPIPYLLWRKIPFYLIQEVVWHYGAGVASWKSYSPRNEKWLWYVKNQYDYTFNLDDVRDPNVKYPNQKKNGKLKCNPLGKNPTDVWEFAKVTSGTNRSSIERTPHPAQFPAALIQRIMLASSNKGDLILDPFIGSGTVAEVGFYLERNVIGIEINPSYASIAAERVENAIKEIKNERMKTNLFEAIES